MSTYTFSRNMPTNESRVALKSKTFELIQRLLYKMGPNDMLRRCVMEEEVPSLLRESHEGLGGGKMGPDVTARKVLLARLWWKTLTYRCTRVGIKL